MRLKDWLKTGLQYAGAVLLGSVMYGLLMAASGTIDFFTMTAMYILLFGAGMGLVFNMSVYKAGLPVAIAFGSTRKETFVGMQCYRLVFTAVLLCSSVVLYLLAGNEGFAELKTFAPIGVGVMLLLHGLGAIMGMVSTKFGKGVLVALSIIAGLLISGAIAGVVLLLIMLGDALIVADDWVLWTFPAAGLVIYALVMIPEYKTIYKYNVKL